MFPLEEVVVVAAAAVVVTKKRRVRKRKQWCHPITSSRLSFGAFHCLHGTLRADPEKFFNFYRMSVTSFDELCSILKPFFQLVDTNMRKHITVEERVAVTLRYLATGASLTDLHYIFRIGVSTLSGIIQDMCKKIWDHTRHITMPVPNKEMWEVIAEGFFRVTDFPNCVGAIDGKHVRVIRPQDSGSMFYNYKHYFSLVLLAACDHNCCFTAVDIGGYGKSSDSSLFMNSTFGNKIINQTLDLPSPCALPGTTTPAMPFVFVADEAFGLSTNVMRPFAGRSLPLKNRVFNYRLSRTRRFIECSFGILSNKWRIFHRPLNVSLDFAEDIIKCCVVLHNFVRTRDGIKFEDTLLCDGFKDTECGSVSNCRSIAAKGIRNNFADYFISSSGEREWQYSRI